MYIVILYRKEVIHMLRIRDVMLLFGVSRTTVYKWMKSGMPHVYVGKLLFFDESQVLDWVKHHGGN